MWLILPEETRDAIRKLRITSQRTLDIDEEVGACFIYIYIYIIQG